MNNGTTQRRINIINTDVSLVIKQLDRVNHGILQNWINKMKDEVSINMSRSQLKDKLSIMH